MVVIFYLFLVGLLTYDRNCEAKLWKSLKVTPRFQQLFVKAWIAPTVFFGQYNFPLITYADLHPEMSVESPGKVQQESKEIMNRQMMRLDSQRGFDTALNTDFVSGSQVAKVIIKLPPEEELESQYPLGVSNPSDQDGKVMICTAIGKEGPPIAARKFHIEGFKFPLFVEINLQDLLHPFTSDSWLSSPLNRENTAITCVLDSDGKLQTVDPSDRYGFAISDPITADDKLLRKESILNLKNRPSGKPYSENELNILLRLDDELNLKGFRELPPQVTPSAASPSVTTPP